MRVRGILTALAFLSVLEAAVIFYFALTDPEDRQDAVLINETVRWIEENWENLENGYSEPDQAKTGERVDTGDQAGRPEDEEAEADGGTRTGLDYAVLNSDGKVLFQTRRGLSESVNAAVIHRDTILDIQKDGAAVGKVLIYNDSVQVFRRRKQACIILLCAAVLVQWGLCAGYFIYLHRVMVKPFQRLKGFAERIAGGNLDIPLEMDRQNLFGAFTESFDIMRQELKRARRAEAEANAAKKELTAKLSHDIRTPVAGIKAASEVGAALAGDERVRENYTRIIRKADQIDSLISNLFSATLEELQQLSVRPEDLESSILKELLENADYLHRTALPAIPDFILYGDRLRLQQVFDNIFANSYKYGNTEIDVTVCRRGNRLAVAVEDYGGGVDSQELPLLKEKYMRGSNAENLEGAGLGLYISDHFMKEMQGELILENGKNGLRVTVLIVLSGSTVQENREQEI